MASACVAICELATRARPKAPARARRRIIVSCVAGAAGRVSKDGFGTPRGSGRDALVAVLGHQVQATVPLRVSGAIAIIPPQKKVEEVDGDKTERIGTDAAPAEGIIHRCGVAGPNHRSAGACAHSIRPRKLRARRAYRLAHTSPRANTACDFRRWAGTSQGRADPRNQGGRYGVDSAGREALAWRRAEYRHDSHRNAGGARRQAR